MNAENENEGAAASGAGEQAPAAASKAKKPATGHQRTGKQPNIALRSGKKPITGHFRDGMHQFSMPDDQSKPFYHAEARRILAMFGDRYKKVTEKGK